ncbi:MAG: phospholipid/cholesterol/gamma-HCH transport system substrate-binding protein [Pseudomonadota bacterium]|nr:phospholipid/cholesterol/gamma-HCH transport system substrate-binding protein [Pseudomonadota bacterium]
MKKDHINYFAVGVFVLAMFLVLFAMFYRVTGQQAGAEDYYVVFDRITGIKRGTAVTYGGFPIGHLGEIEPVTENSRTRYKLHLQIRGDWQIPDDSVAQIVMPGVIADRQIEISEGESPVKLVPRSIIPSREATDMMALVNSIATELDQSIPMLTADASRVIKKLDHSAELLENILNDANRGHLNNAFRNADEASVNMVRLTQSFDGIYEKLDALLENADSLVTDNNAEIRQTVGELRRSVETVSGNMDAILYNLDASSRNMNEFTRQLRNNPGVILGGKPPVDEAEMQK